MNLKLRQLSVRTKKSVEIVDFAAGVTFIHGPVAKGKSSTVRLVDFCLGGSLERTPAIASEFVSAELRAELGHFHCRFERALTDSATLRVSWSSDGGEIGSVNAPLVAGQVPILARSVFNVSDLLFHLCGVDPMKVRKNKRDPDSPLVRLSFRDLMWYCYLEQHHLDSSFFRLEDPNRGPKSRDAMRFFTGLYSERLSQLQVDLDTALDDQRSKRETARQLRALLTRFEFDSGLEMDARILEGESELEAMTRERMGVERERKSETHAAEPLREELRGLSAQIESDQRALADLVEIVRQQEALRSEFITAKTKLVRVRRAERILEGVQFSHCPQCGASVTREDVDPACSLCGSMPSADADAAALDQEALRRDLNERIDELGDSIARREILVAQEKESIARMRVRKAALDHQLSDELARYDSAYVSRVRALDRSIAGMEERLASLRRLRELPEAAARLEAEGGELQGAIDGMRSALAEERARLTRSDEIIAAIARQFHRTMLRVGFPGVYDDDEVSLDPRTWRPIVTHDDISWSYFDVGSGGKRTLFNVCYAVALHTVAAEEGLPVPSLLMVDGPAKNISRDVDPRLVRALYDVIYELAEHHEGNPQIVLVDSDLVPPPRGLEGFSQRRMAGTEEEPSLISYYKGP